MVQGVLCYPTQPIREKTRNLERLIVSDTKSPSYEGLAYRKLGRSAVKLPSNASVFNFSDADYPSKWITLRCAVTGDLSCRCDLKLPVSP